MRLNLTALILFVAVSGALLISRPMNNIVHRDCVRDWCMARSQVDGYRPATVGPTTSFPGLRQGGGWHLHLRLMHAVGVPFQRLDLTLLPLAAAAVATVFLAAGVAAGYGAGLLAAFLLALLYVLVPFRVLLPWNPSMVPLPAAILTMALVGAARDGRWVYYPIAAGALSWLCALHLATYALVPGVLAAVLVARPRRRAALVLVGSGALFVASQISLSMDALLHNLGVLFRGLNDPVYSGAPPTADFESVSWSLPLVGILAWAMLRVRSHPVHRRRTDVLGLLTIPGLLLLVGLAALKNQEISYRYVAALAPPGAVLAGLALARGFSALGRRLGGNLPVNALGFVRLTRHTATPALILILLYISVTQRYAPDLPRNWLAIKDSIALGEVLPGMGITSFEDAFCSLRGPHVREALTALSTQDRFFPLRSTRSETCPEERAWHVVWFEVMAGEQAPRILSYESALDWTHLELSLEHSAGNWSTWRALPFLTSAAYGPGFPSLFNLPSGSSGRIRMRLPVREGAPPRLGLSAWCLWGSPCQVRLKTRGQWTPGEEGGRGTRWVIAAAPGEALVFEWTYGPEMLSELGITPPILEFEVSTNGREE